MFASVSIDIDGLDCYHAIHGLAPPPATGLIHGLALQRYLALLDELGIASTCFVITRYLDADAEAVPGLRAAQDAGHELASHSHNHPYDFGSLDVAGIGSELDRAADALERHLGVRPVGFRCPGYNVSNDVLDALELRGYRYDSSVFPCPPYYFAKLAVMAAMRLRGSKSGSAVTDVRGLLAPTVPYRPARDRFHRRGGGTARDLWEVPMCVVPGLRLPVIGTTLALFGHRRFAAVYGLVKRFRPQVNIEFHGIDFLDADDEGVDPALSAKQPDLRVPLCDKLTSYREALRRMQSDYAFGTIAEMVERLP